MPNDTPRTDALEIHLDHLPRACAEERWPQLCRELEAENAKLRELMRRAIPTIESRITSFEEEFKAACR